ncbi:MAG: hypothetical protein KGL35_04350 [Bradyrhizobium sp.]|nr:hypothetical protein [Bradyrhizobium sp.]
MVSSAIGEFQIGISPIQGGYAPAPSIPQLPVTQIIPSYLYQQYQDDPNLQAFVNAYNTMAQIVLNTFVQVPLPVYTNGMISGALLDWVAQGLYGMDRPTLASGGTSNLGPYNTLTYNSAKYNSYVVGNPSQYVIASDDIFKRCMTWNFFKGDGKQLSIKWLKKRVQRFLTGTNGVDPGVDQTYNVSVTFEAGNVVHIRVLSGSYDTLKSAILSGALQLPFQYTYSVTN